MKSIWVLAVVLAFVAGSIVTGTMAYAASNAQGQPFKEIKAIIETIETEIFALKLVSHDPIHIPTCPAGLTQFGSWCIDPTARGPSNWFDAAVPGCSALGLELIPAGVLTAAILSGFNTVPPGATVWSANIGDDPVDAGTAAEAVVLIVTPPNFALIEIPTEGTPLNFVCGKPL